MAKYRIAGKRNNLEHFWHGGSYYRIQFDSEGFAYTEEEAVAEYYKNRDSFPNEVPYDGAAMGYSVWKMSE